MAQILIQSILSFPDNLIIDPTSLPPPPHPLTKYYYYRLTPAQGHTIWKWGLPFPNLYHQYNNNNPCGLDTISGLNFSPLQCITGLDHRTQLNPPKIQQWIPMETFIFHSISSAKNYIPSPASERFCSGRAVVEVILSVTIQLKFLRTPHPPPD